MNRLFFKILAVSSMMFICLQSNGMEKEKPSIQRKNNDLKCSVPELIKCWTTPDIKNIIKLPILEIIQYWKLFWSQITPDDIYTALEDDYFVYNYPYKIGELKDEMYAYAAGRFDVLFECLALKIKKEKQLILSVNDSVRLCQEVLHGSLNTDIMLIFITDKKTMTNILDNNYLLL